MTDAKEIVSQLEDALNEVEEKQKKLKSLQDEVAKASKDYQNTATKVENLRVALNESIEQRVLGAGLAVNQTSGRITRVS